MYNRLLKINFIKTKQINKYLILLSILVFYSIWSSNLVIFIKIILFWGALVNLLILKLYLLPNKALFQDSQGYKLLRYNGSISLYEDAKIAVKNSVFFILELKKAKSSKKILIFCDQVSLNQYRELNSRLIDCE